MKKLVSIGVSLTILVVVYSLLDVAAIRSALAQTDHWLLSLSLVLLVALVFLSAVRLALLARTGQFHLRPGKAVAATFAANALNMFLPGKLGDILKASLLAEEDTSRLRSAVGIGLWEKLSDFAMLFLMAALPLGVVRGNWSMAILFAIVGGAGIVALVVPGVLRRLLARVPKMADIAAAWGEMVSALKTRPIAIAGLFALTGVIWSGHLVQVGLMAAALGVSGDASFWAGLVAMIPIAIVAGLVPLTYAGVGTRDAALVVLLAPMIGAETAAALGVLFWLRYLVPGFLGAPLLPKFLRVASAQARRAKI